MPDFTVSPQEEEWFSRLARQAVESVFAGRADAPAPEPPDDLRDGLATRILGCFVTLQLDGRLRGCIGTIIAHEPLRENIWRMARAAAFQDFRFSPLTLAEWGRCRTHISILGPLEPCPSPDLVEIGKHGLVLRLGRVAGVFLPEVPVEQGWDRAAYLENLCRKASLPPGSWRHPEAVLEWFTTVGFDA